MARPSTVRIYAFSVQGKFIKFGIASNPLTRIGFVQTGCPYPLTILAMSDLMARSEGFSVEAYIKLALANFRAVGEWYQSNPRTLALAKLVNEASYEKIFPIVFGWTMGAKTKTAALETPMKPKYVISSYIPTKCRN